jgi:hypothetical protein
MLTKTALICGAMAVVLSAPAVSAQTAGSPVTPDISGLLELEDMPIARLGATVQEVEDMDVVGPDGAEIGEVEEILVDASGMVVALTVEVGGFLGIGESEAVVMIDQLGLAADRNSLVASLTREQIELLPEWDD